MLEDYKCDASAYNSTSELWDDGIVDPTDTRNAWGMALSAAINAPIENPHFGVFRMWRQPFCQEKWRFADDQAAIVDVG